MPVQLDIAGSFLKGQEVGIRRRQAKQMERAIDFELAREQEGMLGRRGAIRQQEELYGLDPTDFGEFQTNQDPWFMRMQQWWKKRRAGRVMPSNMMPEQMESVDDESSELGFDRFQEMANGGKVKRAIPSYAEGGSVATEEEMIRRRAAANRARNPATVAARSETAIPRRPGMLSRAGSLARRVVNAPGRGGAAIAGGAAIVPQLDQDYDRTLERRFGFAEPNVEPSQPGVPGDEGDPSLGGFARYFGRRALGYASDLGNVLSFGQAGRAYRDTPESAIPPSVEVAAQPEMPEEIPATPDEAIAQAAIADGTRMAEEAQQRSAPPGAIDFSMVDFTAADIPSMPVKDWIDYRARSVRDLMLQGKTAQEAHAEVTKMQQQGFVDYAQQALMHLQSGNANAAATALRAAYQYFPNGTDVRLGAQMGKDGQPVVVGMGTDEETGEPKGQPMILNSERLALMIENFSNPAAFTAWTKDWRDEQFSREKYEEVERPAAQSQARYQDRAGRAALLNAQANVVEAAKSGGTGGMRQADYDRAYAQFAGSQELRALEDEELANRLTDLMARFYLRAGPNVPYPTVIREVMRANTEGRLDDLEQLLEE